MQKPKINLQIVIFLEFWVVFTVWSFVGNPVLVNKATPSHFQVFEKSWKFTFRDFKREFLIKASVCDIRHFVCSQNNKVYLMHFFRILSFSRYLHLEFMKYLFSFHFQIFTLFRISKSTVFFSLSYFSFVIIFLIFGSI